MKNKSVAAVLLRRPELYLLAVMTLSILPAVSALGQRAAPVDFSMRRALYFTGNETQKIDKTGKYVAENGTMVLNQSQATKCEQDGCYFNLGFIVFRKPAADELATYATLTTQASYVAGIEIVFADKEATKEKILSLKLALGTNKVTFKVDPYEKAAESDEGNNTFVVTITVKPKAVLTNPSGGKPETRKAHASKQVAGDALPKRSSAAQNKSILRARAPRPHKHAQHAQFSGVAGNEAASRFAVNTVEVPALPGGADLQITCPVSVLAGIITTPSGWTDISKRVNYFTGLSVQNTGDGAHVTCDYGPGNSLDRIVAGRVCQRTHPDSLVVVCRAVPTKK